MLVSLYIYSFPYLGTGRYMTLSAYKYCVLPVLPTALFVITMLHTIQPHRAVTDASPPAIAGWPHCTHCTTGDG
jgi:hypothetical protein